MAFWRIEFMEPYMDVDDREAEVIEADDIQVMEGLVAFIEMPLDSKPRPVKVFRQSLISTITYLGESEG